MNQEEEHITAARQGDLSAFNELVLKYQRPVYSVAYHILGDPDAAADAAQDSFLKAYRSLRSYHGGSFRAWLVRIVTNTCYDHLRSRRRHPLRSLDCPLEGYEEDFWLVDRCESPAEYVEHRELGRAIDTGLKALSPDQRIVLVLADIEGLSNEEIACITGSPRGTVKARLSRARAGLRDFLLRQPDLLPSEKPMRPVSVFDATYCSAEIAR